MDEHQMKDEALRLALEALEYPGPSWIEARQPAIAAIKQALAQPVATNDTSQKPVDETAKQRHETEPVKVMGFDCVCGRRMVVESDNGVLASPPKREWQGLTDDERSYYLQTASNIGWWKASEIIEAKLKAKNGFPQTEKNT